ncbi:unnamed protein product [Thelazia callipaeda]|uniref:Activin_recp domain-containing protein n=1 Tax=Thelazia callipaeda TaxID=103827 RepID=A0A0N5CKE3_THECL|nr:unnamed protein product [Thelazia callipaeda]
MVDKTLTVFVLLIYIVSSINSLPCEIFFRKNKLVKANRTVNCESSSCCFTMEMSHGRHKYYMKGCDADAIQDEMEVYAPALSGSPWETIMEACLAHECRIHKNLIGGKGQTYLCGCGNDLCNEKSFEDTFPRRRNSAKRRMKVSMSKNYFLWLVTAFIAICY